MIELRDISKSFPVRGSVLNSLSFIAEPGASIAITGPSGSGKTTLLNIIGLLERPDAGTITFRGDDVTLLASDAAAAYRNRNIGFIFQEHLLLPHLTIRENIWLPFLAGGGGDKRSEAGSQAGGVGRKGGGHLQGGGGDSKGGSTLHSGADGQGGVNSKGAEEHIAMLAERTGITGIMDKYPFQVSGGEAQRAAFVRALARKPALLLADEPTGSLDRKNSDMLAGVLAELNREYQSTLIVVTHSERLAAAMEVRYELNDGKLTGPRR